MLGPSVLNSLSGGGNVYIQGVLTKNGEEGSTDSFVIEIETIFKFYVQFPI